MPTDLTRDLVRRAYRADADLDVTAGLLDVLRRADPPPVEPAFGAPEPRARRGHLLAVAAAILVVIVGIAVGLRGAGAGDGAVPAASRGASAGATGALGLPSATVPAPGNVLPSQCAVAWRLALRGKTFDVLPREGATCPGVLAELTYLADVTEGNGRIEEGFATVWPILPTGGAASVTAPFSFSVPGWPGPVAGHTYELWHVQEGPRAQPGDDATVIYEHARQLATALVN
ncbi:hypothetical protein ACFFX1_48155 [Dactylosporangium sucinum]|uniref:Uncharacterized protein n=1 Tax=Dactylosporangium sucinum TaxID=1424081 RepID=A0A917TP82_9ACTN|nr:hypothetical protein [Dactylosporangium sucinum]GGM29826.1 hypothetical protein GCM10007977_033880 [Dactylosporangium sucinum]